MSRKHKPKPNNELNQLKAEIETASKNPEFGIDTDQLIAFADYRRIIWSIREDGHIKSVRDRIIEINDEFKAKFTALEKRDAPRAELEAVYERSTRQVLDIVLIDFDYDKYADHPKVGPTMLGLLANDISHFLVEFGGRAVSRHLQTLQNINILSRSLSSPASSKNGRYSSGTKTGSDPS